ncbi:MAG: LysM peptidoglycan-binding domain-containing protein [bacterium]
MKFSDVLILVFILGLAFIIFDSALPDLDGYLQSEIWEREYFVSKGETLWDIAEKINGDKDIRLVIAAIKEVNEIDSLLQINQKLILPID